MTRVTDDTTIYDGSVDTARETDNNPPSSPTSPSRSNTGDVTKRYLFRSPVLSPTVSNIDVLPFTTTRKVSPSTQHDKESGIQKEGLTLDTAFEKKDLLPHGRSCSACTSCTPERHNSFHYIPPRSTLKRKPKRRTTGLVSETSTRQSNT
jgi:hypothetical protein